MKYCGRFLRHCLVHHVSRGTSRMLQTTQPRQNLSGLEVWKKYLRYDPTRWLLETNDPSVLLWYQLDIAHRPEDAPGVIETRARVLYSDPVQTIFAAQNEMGFWGDPESLAQPYYTATLWNLALLAELGIPCASRRARNACEFILQNFLNEEGTFAGLNAVESGYLLRALGYFNYAKDARGLRAARTLSERVETFEERICALWGWRAFCEDAEIADAARDNIERVLAIAAQGNAPASGNAAASVPYTLPQFDPRDDLFLLRVLAEYDGVGDARVASLIDVLVGKQNERGQWMLGRDLNAQLVTPLERAGEPSRWVTLNALRVITKRVKSKE